MKKLMILGGSENQLPLIQCAKKLGYYVALCDYSKDNIGKRYADIFHCVSILDKEAILKVAEVEKIDGIVTNSEPAMPISAYVGNNLGLSSNPYESVTILSRKDLFRKFLMENGFNCPQSYDTDDYKVATKKISNFKFPLMVKPIDSSGSRGVSKIDSIKELKNAFNIALSFSKNKRVMIEEYIEKTHEYMIGGDIFVLDGKVEFWGLMNCLRDSLVNKFVPVGKSYPAFISKGKFTTIKDNINKILELLNIRSGAFNVELMFDGDSLFMIEMNPRNGGNRISEILKIITGVDLIKLTVESSLNVEDLSVSCDAKEKFISTYILHSKSKGVFKEVKYDNDIKSNILNIFMDKQKGEQVDKFNSADKLLGIVFLEFGSLKEMKYKLEHIKELIEVIIN